MANAAEVYGWTAVPRKQDVFLKDINKSNTRPVEVSDIPLPSSNVVNRVHEYAKEHLPEQTYNHSMRVFYYGSAMVKQHFPQFSSFTETYLLTCLLHDIGTTKPNLRATHMSFEFYGGMLSHSLIANTIGAPVSQAEAVCEAVIRHQDLGETGEITSLGQLIQLATVFDNMGINPELVHKDTIESVTHAFPRKGWSGCFASTIREEIGLKPWCHTTVIDGFAEGVENNRLMAPYDKGGL